MPEQNTDVIDSMDALANGVSDNQEGDLETPEESSTDQQEDQESSGEDVNAEDFEESEDQSEQSEESDSDDKEPVEGQPVPYDRFKKIIDEKNASRQEIESTKTELEDLKSVVTTNPEVYRAVLKAKGYTEEAITRQLQEKGLITPSEDIDGETFFKKYGKGLDLNNPETASKNWAIMQQRALADVKQTVVQELTAKMEAEKRTKEALKKVEILAKERDIPFGVIGEDDKKVNTETAIGKLVSYINKHPEKANYDPTDLFLLAIGDGIELGKHKGIKQEKNRQEKLKRSQMEDGVQTKKGKKADFHTMSYAQLNEYMKTHPEEVDAFYEERIRG